jgi:hypothetical protein
MLATHARRDDDAETGTEDQLTGRRIVYRNRVDLFLREPQRHTKAGEAQYFRNAINALLSRTAQLAVRVLLAGAILHATDGRAARKLVLSVTANIDHRRSLIVELNVEP